MSLSLYKACDMVLADRQAPGVLPHCVFAALLLRCGARTQCVHFFDALVYLYQKPNCRVTKGGFYTNRTLTAHGKSFCCGAQHQGAQPDAMLSPPPLQNYYRSESQASNARYVWHSMPRPSDVAHTSCSPGVRMFHNELILLDCAVMLLCSPGMAYA